MNRSEALQPRRNSKEITMGLAKDGAKDQMAGIANQVKGKTKEVVGAVKGDPDQEADGNLQKNIGKVQTQVGRAERKLA
jgi:uncharacterized protein YjbJ (UPF0337 family)